MGLFYTILGLPLELKSVIQTQNNQKYQLEVVLGIEAVSSAEGRSETGFRLERGGGNALDGSGGLNGLNRRMETAGPVNEAMLEAFLAELEECGEPSSAGYWLTAARIFERALLCLGDYADAGEFRAAGDLLVNPRRVEVYVRGETMPRVKPRHGGVSAHFGGGACRAEALGWFRRETLVRVSRPPLLPDLFGRLRDSERFRMDYLESGDRRMKRAASAMAFRWVGRFSGPGPDGPSGEVFSAPRSCRGSAGRCDFTAERFEAMGRELSRMNRASGVHSRFLQSAEH